MPQQQQLPRIRVRVALTCLRHVSHVVDDDVRDGISFSQLEATKKASVNENDSIPAQL
jgi:hypothetical protein